MSYFSGGKLLVLEKLTPPKINMEFLKMKVLKMFFLFNFGEL